jgi:hypothetical protein
MTMTKTVVMMMPKRWLLQDRNKVKVSKAPRTKVMDLCRLVLSCLVLSCLILSYLVFSCLVLFLSRLVLSCLVSSRLVLSRLVLPVMSCNVLPCFVLSSLVPCPLSGLVAGLVSCICLSGASLRSYMFVHSHLSPNPSPDPIPNQLKRG